MTVINKIPIHCKTVLLTCQLTVHRSIARYQTVDQWPYFHWFNKSCDIDIRISRHHHIRGLDGRGYLRYLMDMWVERMNKKILKIWRCITNQSETVASQTDLERISIGSVCLITIGSLKSFLCPPLKFCTCQSICRSVDQAMSAVDLLTPLLENYQTWYSGRSMRVDFPMDFQVKWSKVKVKQYLLTPLLESYQTW